MFLEHVPKPPLWQDLVDETANFLEVWQDLESFIMLARCLSQIWQPLTRSLRQFSSRGCCHTQDNGAPQRSAAGRMGRVLMWRRPVPCGLKAGLKAKIHSGILLQIHSKLREVRDVSDQNARSNSGLGIIVFCPDDLKECTPFSTYIYWYVNDMLTSEGRNVAFSLCNTWAFANGSGKLYPFRCNISTATKGVATKVGRFFHFFTEDRVSLTDLNRSISLPWIKRSRACLFFFSRFVHEQITKHQQSKKWNKHGFWMDQVFCLWFLFFSRIISQLLFE